MFHGHLINEITGLVYFRAVYTMRTLVWYALGQFVLAGKRPTITEGYLVFCVSWEETNH